MISDSRFNKILGTALKTLGFYAPLLFLLAPLSKAMIAVVAGLAVLAIGARLSLRVPFWMSAIFILTITFACQLYQSRPGDTETYFVECNALEYKCFVTHNATVLGQEIRIWPYHVDLPVVGAYKKYWTRNAFGRETFRESSLVSSDRGDAIYAPTELAAFRFLKGTQSIKGVQFPYRSTHTTHGPFPNLEYSVEQSGRQGLAMGLGASIWQKTNSIHPTKPLKDVDALSFSADGDPTAPGTWLRAARNDLWMRKMATENGDDLIAMLAADATPLSRSERLLFDVYEMASWCQGNALTSEKIGCRGRHHQLAERIDALAGDPTHARPVMSELMAATKKQISIVNRVELPQFDLDLSGELEVPANLEKSLRDRFPGAEFKKEKDENARCGFGQLAAALRNEIEFTLEIASRFVQTIKNCSADEKANYFETLLKQSKEEFGALLSALLSTTNDEEWRPKLIELVVFLEQQLNVTNRALVREIGQASMAAILGGVDRVIYSDATSTVIDAYRKLQERELFLTERREQILDALGDSSQRVGDFLGARNVEADIQMGTPRAQIQLVSSIADGLERLKSAHPVSSGNFTDDWAKFNQINADLVDKAAFRSFVTAYIGRVARTFGTEQDQDIVAQCVMGVLEAWVATNVQSEEVPETEEFGPRAILQGANSLATRCKLDYLVRATDEALARNFDHLPDVTQWLTTLRSDTPIIGDVLAPTTSALEPSSRRNVTREAYRVRYLDFIGGMAVGLSAIDWRALPPRGNRSSAYPFVQETITPEIVATAKAQLCSLWDGNANFSAAILTGERIWKQTGALLPMYALEEACADDTTATPLAAALGDFLGPDVIERYADTKVHPLRRTMIQHGEIKTISDLIISGKSTYSQRRIAARYALFARPPPVEHETDNKVINNSEFLWVLLAPSQKSAPLEADLNYLTAFDSLATIQADQFRGEFGKVVFDHDPDLARLVEILPSRDGKIIPFATGALQSLISVIEQLKPSAVPLTRALQ